MPNIGERLSTGLLVVSALAIAIVVVRRELITPAPRVPRAQIPPVLVKDWQQLRAHGRWIGDSNAKVQVIEFADFQCPFCRKFNEAYEKTKTELGGDVSLLLIQFPLTAHHFAKPAALAAECAAAQGHYAEYHSVLFSNQDSLGLKSWASYAVDAGIRDTVPFNKCVTTTRSSARLAEENHVADSLGVRATPTVLINGWRYEIAPYDSLSSVVRAQLRAASTH